MQDKKYMKQVKALGQQWSLLIDNEFTKDILDTKRFKPNSWSWPYPHCAVDLSLDYTSVEITITF